MRINFNPPINLNNYGNILLVGIGGGYDVFGGIPLMLQFPDRKWVLANYNIKLNKMQLAGEQEDNPESRLHEWLRRGGLNIPVYGLPRVGVGGMMACLEKIVRDHKIDCLVLMDGGVDSLMHGDEYDAGTVIEDTVTMTAAAVVPVEAKFLVCMGFGTELEEGLCHYHALQNIAELAKAGAFLGSCSLVNGMDAYRRYKNACEFAWSAGQRKSHIQTRVISAVQGEFGESNLYEGVDAQIAGAGKVMNFITPLMGLYWFFDFGEVIQRNKLMPVLLKSNTHTDVLILFKQAMGGLRSRKSQSLPY